MKKNLTELVFILDKSGSMRGLEKDTIGGYNSMLEQQRKIDGECGIVHVSIYNRYAGEIRFDGGMPLTGKADRSAHGYGLRSVAMLVEKYGGEMSIDANGGVFSVGLAFWQDEE